jgi:hypothetical protein
MRVLFDRFRRSNRDEKYDLEIDPQESMKVLVGKLPGFLAQNQAIVLAVKSNNPDNVGWRHNFLVNKVDMRGLRGKYIYDEEEFDVMVFIGGTGTGDESMYRVDDGKVFFGDNEVFAERVALGKQTTNGIGDLQGAYDDLLDRSIQFKLGNLL